MNLKIKFELEETELKGEIENLIPSSSGGSLPSGGTTGQVLTKNSNADGDAGWKDISGYLSEKLDKNQGTANSGKFLGIGADGIVVPTEVGGGSSKNYRKIAEVTISEEVSNIVINKDLNGDPFEITNYLICGTNVKGTGSAQIITILNTTSTSSWGWTGVNDFMNATIAKTIYMESVWIGRRILRLVSSQFPTASMYAQVKPNNELGNVEKITCINLLASANAFAQGTISVWGG